IRPLADLFEIESEIAERFLEADRSDDLIVGFVEFFIAKIEIGERYLSGRNATVRKRGFGLSIATLVHTRVSARRCDQVGGIQRQKPDRHIADRRSVDEVPGKRCHVADRRRRDKFQMLVQIREDRVHYRRLEQVGDGRGRADLDKIAKVTDAAKLLIEEKMLSFG